ncbi:micrococcal nuclease-like nuclease [Cylindrospermum stagnale PCC 7417]|uniref:Micrococcal nuclease-like nuclease n=1 Tax=Cylindrospermum stagnale PCC 7417 TaxID=56107 RepID=K9X5A6_9NOST|nr:PhnD/SsuA/transferrin family substrate-binding protein [Cylindrospermum stagnale]AFZ27251.1 micrococcal nuclease-like nuclease [Cylindrospermum stagnale PCC 7417]
MSNSKNNHTFIKFIAFAGVLSLSGCKPNLPKPPVSSPYTVIENKQQGLQTSSLTIGILSKPGYYQELTTYLRSQFGNKVQIVLDGDESISYEEVRKRLINKEWDIAFTLSPILSIAAKNNDYRFAARMFPNNPPYYQAALFAKSNSSIQSLSDLKSTNTIAMGDFNSASSFYIPAYDLFGKSLKVNMGHRGKDIKDLVKTGKADLGAAAYDTVKNDKAFKIIHLSKQVPGSSVYLSPKLSESDREIIKKLMLDAPDNIKKQANYGSGEEPNYSQLIHISRKAEEVLRCANFQINPVNFFCSKSKNTPVQPLNTSNTEMLGQINGWSRRDSETETFNLSGKDNKVYQIVIPRKILNQVPGASNPIALQGKEVKIINVVPQKTQRGILELKITQPNQLNLLENVSNSPTQSSVQVKRVISNSPSQSSYQVKQVDDGDTITVTDKSGEEIRVRFACIDTAEIPHSDAEKNSTAPANKNQFLWGNKAKERLESLIKPDTQVTLNIVDTDRYGRKVAEVRLPDGTFTQQILVKEGLAMVYRKYLKSCPSATIVEQAEAEAKQQSLNIWGDSQFIAPWDWRSQKKSSNKPKLKTL